MTFQLDEHFLNAYKDRSPEFGFNGLGELTYRRTYSRIKPDGTNEDWWETIKRVVESTYEMQRQHITKLGLGWKDAKGQKSAQEMYDRMFNMKFLPPGRGLWAMGTETIAKHGSAALNNCGFVSTADIANKPADPFCFLMDMSMLGVGIGFDTLGAKTCKIHEPTKSTVDNIYQISDDREGWVKSVHMLLSTYLSEGLEHIEFDYSLIRAAGEPIRGFGGVASGPEPLRILHERIRTLFDGRAGDLITKTDIVDIMNMIGCCVVAGNVRRTAEIVISDADDEYLKLKDFVWDKTAKRFIGSAANRAEWGWSSNNSILAKVGDDFTKPASVTAVKGEPGYVFLENCKAYSRMNGTPDYKDKLVQGVNPCSEQTLENYELCCLVEVFPTKAKDKEDFLRTLKFAYLYAKTVTLMRTHDVHTNRVLLRNRRIGTSMSGLAMFIDKYGHEKLRDWCESGYDTLQKYDEIYSDWLTVPRSKKMTSIKPSGSVSLLPGVTPGIHYPEANYYIRRIRLSKNSPLVSLCINKGYHVEDDVVDNFAVVVSVPVAIEGIRTINDLSIWEQAANVAFMQRHWADNAVSNTIKVQKHELNQIANVLNLFQYHVKALSFLPVLEHDEYPQMPYETISKDRYEQLAACIQHDVSLAVNTGDDGKDSKFCDNDSCAI